MRAAEAVPINSDNTSLTGQGAEGRQQSDLMLSCDQFLNDSVRKLLFKLQIVTAV